ncbi:hypothetical protein V5O48_011420 [Marasmius crinis-equi]|uniref:Ferritin-like domain-containing protein n=1 Tax=Marasmius crinis-equi TaxID=585013 RepID=A0ABR3F5S6_9AGAR
MWKYFTCVTLLAAILPLSTHAISFRRNNSPATNDANILNFALSLEHLEYAFYNQGLSKFSDNDFQNGGQSKSVGGWYRQILFNEQTHVQTLQETLSKMKVTAVQPCNYSFPYNDTKGFIMLSSIFETVGASAYTGAVSLLSDKDLKSKAGSILGIEARQSAWITAVPQNANPWSGQFQIPLTLNQAFTLASPFIASCPPSNPKLPAKANPALNISPAQARPGDAVTLSFNNTSVSNGTQLYMVFQTYSGTRSASINRGNNSVVLPGVADLRGTVFASVSTRNDSVDDSTTVAGPMVLLFPFDSSFTLLQVQ